MRETRMASVAMLLTGAGALGLGFVAKETVTLVLFTIIWSMGDHIIFAVESPIGLNLARQGAEGRRLGQVGGVRNLGLILGLGVVYLLAKIFGDRYDLFYLVSAIAACAAGVCYFKLKVGRDSPPSRKIVFKRKYGIFYAVSALFGVRKQIFMAFGGWVLVSIHGVSVETIALLYIIAAGLGIVLRPLLGDVIDWHGERTVLAADEILLVIICMTYAFAGDLFPKPYALWVLYSAYVLDSVLFSLRIARVTYLKKIADHPSEITPSISLGITIDHSVAMSLPILSGYVWERFGFRWVFVIAAAIAIAGFFVCLRIRVPKTPPSNGEK
jgi:predicted MFS family arabinose efflux permease